MWVGLIQSIEGLNRAKRSGLGEVAPSLLELGDWAFALRLGQPSCGSLASRLRLELHHQLSWVSAYRRQMVGLLNLHNPVIPNYIYVYISYIFLIYILF